MAFIETIPPSEATGEVREMYERQQQSFGYVPNYAKVYCYRPEVMGLWARLQAGIRSNLDTRRFELVTLAASKAVRSSYCSLAHGRRLGAFYSPAELDAIARDGDAPLSEAERAMMAFARRVAGDAPSVTASDVDGLKALGFSDAEIFDIAAAAAARAFFAKLGDGLGVEADAEFLDLDESLRESLTVGRPISTQAPEVVDPLPAG